MKETLGQPRLVSWPSSPWNGIWVLTLLIIRSFGLLLNFGMQTIWPWVWRDHPCVWTDGSREQYLTGGFEVAGAGVYLPAPDEAFLGAVWGTAQDYGDARLERCGAFCAGTRSLQSVQLAELWGAILALQAFWPCHLGIDNLNVVRSVGRLLDHGSFSSPLLLVKDGDLIAVVQHMILARGAETVKVTEVKGHATEDDEGGCVRRISGVLLRQVLPLDDDL